MKKWFLERFLPMWAKQTVLADNRQLTLQNHRLNQRLRELQAYVDGLHRGLKSRARQGGMHEHL